VNRIPFALSLLALATACSDKVQDKLGPLDRFYYPTALAVRHYDTTAGSLGADCVGGAPGCVTQLLVASANFDLFYSPTQGGTVLSVRVPSDAEMAARAAAAPTPGRPADFASFPDLSSDLTGQGPLLMGAVRIGSYAGDLVVADDRTCPGWSRGPQALVASRTTNRLHRIDLGAGSGELSCPDGCATPLDDRFADPYGIALACRGNPSDGTFLAGAYVGYLVAPLNEGFISRIDLLGSRATQAFSVGFDPPHALLYQAARDRLLLTGRFGGSGIVPFRWVDLGVDGLPFDVARLRNLASDFAGAETSGLALSSDGNRAYLGMRLYDVGLASLGGRPGDTGGTLAVLDMADDPVVGTLARPLFSTDVGRGPGEVRAVARTGKGDLVAVTCPGDDTLWLYDDELGRVVKVVARDAKGSPLLGRQPFGMAVERRAPASAAAPGLVRLYVAAFGSDVVNVIDLDPDRPQAAELRAQLGALRP
jgi:hypothetical protein